MACRDTKRAQDAREKLYRPLDKHIATYRQGTEDHGYVVAEKLSLEPASTSNVAAPNGEFHHYIVSPGITAMNMNTLPNISIPGYRYLMLASFYVCALSARLTSSCRYSAAVAAVYLALIPHFAIPTPRDTVHVPPEDIPWSSWHSYFGKFTRDAAPPRVLTLRFGSENDGWVNGCPRAMAMPVWDEHQWASAQLLERFKRLYQVSVLKKAEGVSDTAANEHAE
ncbi:uncharacterized protein TRAVEDRAFT_65863 [Trametes versicolor FP-101664 SS1]|uniref:uncharacterized protein n=1 Tax=Trametes versicolor (strain FP-101664) TaxID=717944 RepID=UPI0004622670|nr:uncharacterized protein TRAVEDRAFT_65863 [Trametes versicolor FP-101664 SS1]EIW57004.1 hypothetical protein TRAVEDRAFT_65863 [Trametes versicolor FP-101664 SS1]